MNQCHGWKLDPIWKQFLEMKLHYCISSWIIAYFRWLCIKTVTAFRQVLFLNLTTLIPWHVSFGFCAGLPIPYIELWKSCHTRKSDLFPFVSAIICSKQNSMSFSPLKICRVVWTFISGTQESLRHLQNIFNFLYITVAMARPPFWRLQTYTKTKAWPIRFQILGISCFQVACLK